MSGRKDDQSKLDEYVLGQLRQHYGSDVVEKMSRTAPPSPPPKKFKKGFSFAIVTCAVVFLTGAAMFAGVLFSGGIPTSEHGESSSAVSSEAASSTSKSTSSTPVSSAVESSSSMPVSSAVESSSSTPVSSAEEYSSENTSTENASLFSTSSSEDVENSAVADYSRIDSYSLPDTSSDGYTIESDANNNSETNPYDIVKTGRRARAGVGIFLMISSLCSAAALYNLYREEDETYDRT